MKLASSKRERRVILIAGCLTVAIGWIYARYVVGPLIRGGTQLKGQVIAARATLKALEAALVNEAAVRGQYQQAQEKVKSLRSFLPTQGELSAVIGRLSDLASQTRVSIQSIFPQRTAVKEEGGRGAGAAKSQAAAAQPAVYEEVVIQINARADFHQLGAFVSLVESGKQPMRVARLRIAPDPDDHEHHRIDVLVRAYFATGEPALGDGASAGGGKS